VSKKDELVNEMLKSFSFMEDMLKYSCKKTEDEIREIELENTKYLTELYLNKTQVKLRDIDGFKGVVVGFSADYTKKRSVEQFTVTIENEAGNTVTTNAVFIEIIEEDK